MVQLILVVHNIRSTHNVGSLLRTADGLGLEAVYLTGYTPYPAAPDDERLPHLAQKLTQQIHKTALGAETTVPWRHFATIDQALAALRQSGFTIAALEQAAGSIALPDFQPPPKLAIIVGREVEGLEPEVLQAVDQIIEIPMAGLKESFNVAIAAAMALYHCRFRA